LLRNILESADAAIEKGTPAADLRFGHDTHLIRLLALMQIEGCSNQEVDMEKSLERNLFAAYYAACARSSSKFMRRWAEFDRTLRNIAAAFAARRRGIPVAEVIVGTGDIESALARSSAADFGIKGEVAYVDRVMLAVADDSNLVEKENRMDAVRWEMADELTLTNYFDLDFILGYLVKVNIIHRWAALDPQRGREMLGRLVEGLTASGTLPDM